jgi:hypothetical protein
MSHSFRPGDKVIWLKCVGGDFGYPVSAKVVATTPKRITILAHDPDEKGEGNVTRHVRPESLQLRQVRPGKPTIARRSKRRADRHTEHTAAGSFEERYPHVTSWVQDGWIEIGHDDCGRPFLRAMDIGGLVWEGDGPYPTMDDALGALDDGIGAWLEEMS